MNEWSFKRIILFFILYLIIAFTFPYPSENALLIFLSAWIVFLLPIFIVHCVDVLFYGKDWNIFKTEPSKVSAEEVRKIFSDVKIMKDEGMIPKGLKTMKEVQDYLETSYNEEE